MAGSKARDEVNAFVVQPLYVVRGVVPLVEDHREVFDLCVGEVPDTFNGPVDRSRKERCVVFGSSIEFVDKREPQPPDNGNR